MGSLWSTGWMVLFVGGSLSGGPTFICVFVPTLTHAWIPGVKRWNPHQERKCVLHALRAACMGVCHAMADACLANAWDSRSPVDD